MKEKSEFQGFIDELYFGSYGLEDIKMLDGIKEEFLQEYLEKIIYTLHIKFLKYGYSPIMFGTGFKLTKEQTDDIKEICKSTSEKEKEFPDCANCKTGKGQITILNDLHLCLDCDEKLNGLFEVSYNNGYKNIMEELKKEIEKRKLEFEKVKIDDMQSNWDDIDSYIGELNWVLDLLYNLSEQKETSKEALTDTKSIRGNTSVSVEQAGEGFSRVMPELPSPVHFCKCSDCGLEFEYRFKVSICEDCHKKYKESDGLSVTESLRLVREMKGTEARLPNCVEKNLINNTKGMGDDE